MAPEINFCSRPMPPSAPRPSFAVTISPVLSPVLGFSCVELPGEKHCAGFMRASWETGSAFLDRPSRKSTSKQNGSVQ